MLIILLMIKTKYFKCKGNVIIEDTIKNYTFNANDITYFKNEEKIITKELLKLILIQNTYLNQEM